MKKTRAHLLPKEVKRLEKKHEIFITQHPGDSDLYTVVYSLDVPAADVQHACLEALKIMQGHCQYDKDYTQDGPVFGVITPEGKRFTVDFNEIDGNGQDGSITEE